MLSDTIKHTISALDAETRLFLACCRFSPTEIETKNIRNLAAEVRDWNAVQDLAGRHSIVTLIYKNLQLHLKDSVPPDVLERLQKSHILNTMSVLKLAAELGRVSRLFESGKIRMVALKGPALSMRLYSDVAFRSYGDLDILTDVDNMDRAEAILHDNGYKRYWPELRLTSRRKDFFFKTFHHFNYYNRDRRVGVELHFSPCQSMYQSLTDINDVSVLKYRVDNNLDMKIMSLTDAQMILYLCEHGSNHAWSSLKWLTDVSELLFSMQEADWRSIARNALKQDLDRSLVQGVALANGLLGAPYPEALRKLITPDRVTSELTVFALKEIGLTPSKPSMIPMAFRTIPYNVRRRRGLKYKLAALKRKWVTTAQFRDYDMPDCLFPLYLFVRPLFWLFSSGKKSSKAFCKKSV